MIITYDSTRAVTVTKQSDTAYYIKMYDLNTGELTFEELVGNKDTNEGDDDEIIIHPFLTIITHFF